MSSSKASKLSDDDGDPASCANMTMSQESDKDQGGEEEDFVFSDQFHRQQEFERLTASLANFGLIDKDLVDEVIADTHQQPYLPLPQQQKQHPPQEQAQETSSTTPPKQASLPVRSRRESKVAAFQLGEEVSFAFVLDEIDAIEKSQARKGLSNSNFTFGLMNCLIIAYTFGAHPQHFWILYLIETIFWVSWKFHLMWNTKPLCEVLYYLDYCWIMNFLGVLMLLSFVILGNDRIDAHATLLPTNIRKQLFLGAFGTFAGPVFLAAMALPFVAFLFHDVNTMANLVIHLMPSMAIYNFRWHAKDLHDAYPTLFNLQYLHDMESQDRDVHFDGQVVVSPTLSDTSLGNLSFWNGFQEHSVARNGMLVYCAWWIPYTLWMLLYGLKLPIYPKKEDKNQHQPKYDTVFHSLWRGGPCELAGKLLWKRPKHVSREQSERNDFEVRDLMVYMIGHAVACTTIGIGIVGRISYSGQLGHALMLLLTTIICAERGAQRYTFYVTAMYGQKLRKAYKERTQNRVTAAAVLNANTKKVN